MYPKTIGGKEYTKQQLIDYGRAHYPKFYRIPRGLGIGFMALGGLFTFIEILLILNYQQAIDEYNESIKHYQYITVEPEEFNPIYYIYLGLMISIFIAGVILLCVSFKNKTDEQYIAHAEKDLMKRAQAKIYQESYSEHRNTPQYDVDTDPSLEELKRLKRLLDEGLITQDIYEAKREAYVNGR